MPSTRRQWLATQLLAIAACVGLSDTLAFAQSGGSQRIPRDLIAGGGVSSRGAPYRLSATAGQVHVGISGGSGTILHSGFWTVGSHFGEGNSVRGTIRYHQSNHPVSGVAVHLTGPSSRGVSTDKDGSYEVPNVEDGAWTSVPLKLGDRGNGVDDVDARLALEAAVGVRDLLGLPGLACDVTGDGSVSAFDAALILQLAANVVPSLPARNLCGSDWLFAPAPTVAGDPSFHLPRFENGSCILGDLRYDTLNASITGQDFEAILVGDCSSDWQPAATSAP